MTILVIMSEAKRSQTRPQGYLRDYFVGPNGPPGDDLLGILCRPNSLLAAIEKDYSPRPLSLSTMTLCRLKKVGDNKNDKY